jgi:hypothetical protein
MAHGYNCEFKASLSYIARPYLLKKALVAHICNLTIWEAEIGRIEVQGQTRQIVCKIPPPK